MAELKAKYACTESELYAITEMAIDNLEADLPAFAAKKAKYTNAFVLDLRNMRQAAMDLPGEEQRNAVHETLGGLLPGLKDNCRDNFNDLQGYIRDAWPGENPKARYEAAGMRHDQKIGKNNWEEVVALNNSMVEFITANSATLIAPGGMPATFAAQVAADLAKFNDVYNPYMAARETGTATAAKLKANNDLYDACMSFFKDGVEMVFKRDADAQKRYIFTALKDIVSPPGSTSMSVTAKKADDNLWGEGISIKIKAEGKPEMTAVTNANSVAVFKNIDPSKYAGTVTTPNGVTNFNKTADTGVDARITVVAS